MSLEVLRDNFPLSDIELFCMLPLKEAGYSMVPEVISLGQKQPRRNEMLAWWPNMELQAILLQIFIVQENNIAHSEFYKFMEIF